MAKGWVCAAGVLLGVVVGSIGCDTKSPKARANRMVAVVESARDRSAKVLAGAGLPPPPKTTDLLTGGKWSLFLDLRQATDQGVPRSAQLITGTARAYLLGMVVHYADCLGESVPMRLQDRLRPETRMYTSPPGARTAAEGIRSAMTPERRRALQTAQAIFVDAFCRLDDIERYEPFLIKPEGTGQ